jgi:hypothetical protein
MAIFFVTERYLKLYGMITSNVDASDFTPLIQFASKAFVKKQIGSYFFNDLLTKYNNQTLNQYETELVEIMQFAIAWRATAEATLSLTYQLKNKGLQKQNDDNSESVDKEEATFMYDQYIQKAQYFELELKQFLLDNKNDYPVYLDKLNKDSQIKNDQYNAKGDQFNEGTGMIII